MHAMSMRMETDNYDDPRSSPFARASTGVPRVVLAEDDTETRNLLACFLRWEGYDVSEVSDGVELLARLEAAMFQGAPVDAVIADIKMPRLSGLEVLKAVGREHCTTPFILITAHSTQDALASAQGLGATAVLKKPFPIHRLDAALRAALDS